MKTTLKKVFLLMAVVITAVLCLAFSASAETEGYYTYSVSNGEATITYVDTSIRGDVTIPDTLGGYRVTTIDTKAFQYCYALKSITIPDGVTSIGSYAFRDCRNLTSVIIADSVTSIGSYAFYDCKSISSITIPFVGYSLQDTENTHLGRIFGGYTSYYVPSSLKTVTITKEIDDNAFSGCTGLTDIIISDSVTSIGSDAFAGCTGITSITIPDSVTSIGSDAFAGCTGITSITIPDSVTSIGSSAFSGCTGITSIIIPDSVTQIGSDAFYECTGITNITIPDSVTSIGSYAFYGCKSLTSITIPDSITSIEEDMFSGCSSLTSITIPDSVTSIGSYAFRFCTSLTSITIPDSVTSIGHYAFNNTGYYNDLSNWTNDVLYIDNHLIEARESVTLCNVRQGTKTIVDLAFCECSNLTNITIPNSVVSIGYLAFCECSSLTSITIPDSVVTIGANAFERCTGLTSITIPDSVVTIGANAFERCTGLTSATIGKAVTTIGEKAFSYCEGLKSIVIPDSVVAIGSYAFEWCTNLTSVTIGKGVTTMGSWVFIACDNIANVTIGKGVTTICSYAFSGSTIKNVSIPDGVITIGEGAFEYCGLTKIILPASLKSIGANNFPLRFDYVFYKGTEAQKKNISIASEGNEGLLSDAVWHYQSTGHSYNSYTVAKEVTCIADGLKQRTCSVCKDVETVVIEKLGHSWSNACDESCNRRGCSETRIISHHYNAATCTKPLTCTVCKVTRGKALGHRYDSYCDTICNICSERRTITHTNKTTTTKATLTKNGKVETKCTVCGKVSKTTTVYYPKTIKLSATKYTYNGKALTPSVTVKDSKGNTLKKNTDYTVKYSSGRKATGKYTVTITFKGKYSGTKALSYYILPSKTSKITITSATTSLKASWKAVTGATGYKVELLNSKGKAVKTVTTTKLTYTFSKLSKVTTYKVRVTAYKTIDSKKVYSTVSTTITTSTAPAKATLSKVTAGSKSATPVWKKVSGASGYEVQYSTSKNMKSAKTATVKKGATTKTTIKKLTKGKTYYFKVRAYKTVDGAKVYGAWSAVKSVKIK